MSLSLYHLVYHSRNRLNGDPSTMTAAIDEILAKSRANNDVMDVGGALMFNAGCFAQVLEGPRDAIETTFERIQQDDRHGDVSLLAFGPIEHRAFDKWSMAFVGTSALYSERYAHIGGESGFDPSRMSGDRIHGTLHRLVLEEELGGV